MKTPVDGQSVLDVHMGYTVELDLSDDYFIRIETACILEKDGDQAAWISDGDDGSSAHAYFQLVGDSIAFATIADSGALDVSFAGGARLHVEPDMAYESWTIGGRRGVLIVCMPGGELATWSDSDDSGSNDSPPR